MATRNKLPSQRKLKEDFTYDPETGDFIKYDGKWGWINNNGYINIMYEDTIYVVHRLIWMWVYGVEPDQIDHINGDRQDNRIENLRNVDHLTNQRNRAKNKNNKSGFNGVYWHNQSQRWRAEIIVDGKPVYIGSYDIPQEAANARQQFIAEFMPCVFTDRHGT